MTYLVIEGDRPLRYSAVYARYAGVDCFTVLVNVVDVPSASFPPFLCLKGKSVRFWTYGLGFD
jgi:hypothetical protein